ncbi:MAG: hypothetical protein ACPG0M_00005 [Litorivicinaceae bacterium]
MTLLPLLIEVMSSNETVAENKAETSEPNIFSSIKKSPSMATDKFFIAL